MNLSELLIMLFPILLILGGVFFIKKENSFPWFRQWFGLAFGCGILSFLMLRHLSGMMGGGWIWKEVIYYGWFLLAIFSIIRAVKKCLFAIVKPVKLFHLSEKFTQNLKNIFVFVVLFLLAIPFVLAMTSIFRPKIMNIHNPQEMLGLAYEDVTLTTKDNLRIRGWFVPAKSNKAVIIGHGLGANKSNFIATVELWNLMGYNALIFDFRGHGDSDGHTVTFGYKERYDIFAAMDYLVKEKKFIPENIWGYGVSFGGAAMINAAAEDHRFRGLIIDSSFADLDHMAQKIVERQVMIPVFCRRVVKEIGFCILEWSLGYDVRRSSPLLALQNLSRLPILFIHSKGDGLIPWTEAELLYRKAPGPKQIYLVNTVGHYSTLEDVGSLEAIKHFLLSNGQ